MLCGIIFFVSMFSIYCMPRVKRYTLLTYVPEQFLIEENIKKERIFAYNKKPVSRGNIVYLMERELRVKDNFALNFALQKSRELNRNLKIIHILKHYESENKQNFYNRQVQELKESLSKYDFELTDTIDDIQAGLLIIDFNPINNENYLKNVNFKILEVDSHNIVPARFISDKQEYSAATFRRKLYVNIYDYLTDFPAVNSFKTLAEKELDNFINNKLDLYAQYKNRPDKDVTSNLSRYLNLGFISSQRIAMEVIKSGAKKENKESFLEELIIRKELADNFCLYCKNYKTLECAPNWAKETLKKHENDYKKYLYTKEELEQAKTHDLLWNYAQRQLLTKGKIHSYLRMYWAKKILKWTASYNAAIDISIYLNDKYALDSPSSNGYVGILWSIAGLHDRPFSEYSIFGKIRRMNGKNIEI